MTPELKHIIESLLFVADAPLPLDRIKTALGTTDSQAVRTAIDALERDYAARGGGFFLEEVAGGYQLRSRPEFTEYIRRLVKPVPVRLSKAALETLAIIAYKQPVIRTDVEHIRGVDCGGVLRMLLERRMIRVLGRKEIPGRPLLYGTTRQFLEIFGLKDLKELPSPREIEEFGRTLTDAEGGLFEIEAGDEGPTGQAGSLGEPHAQQEGPGEGADPKAFVPILPLPPESDAGTGAGNPPASGQSGGGRTSDDGEAAGPNHDTDRTEDAEPR